MSAAERFLVILVAGLSIPAFSREGARIEIDPHTRYQTIEGWGGHVYPQTLPFIGSDPTFLEDMLDELHTTHIRVQSVSYLLGGQNDNDDPRAIDWKSIAAGDTGLVRDEFLLQQVLAKRNVKLLFTSWRFPYWMMGKLPSWNPTPDERHPLPRDMEDE